MVLSHPVGGCRKQPASTHPEPSLVEQHSEDPHDPEHVLLSPGDGLELTTGEWQAIIWKLTQEQRCCAHPKGVPHTPRTATQQEHQPVLTRSLQHSRLSAEGLFQDAVAFG